MNMRAHVNSNLLKRAQMAGISIAAAMGQQKVAQMIRTAVDARHEVLDGFVFNGHRKEAEEATITVPLAKRASDD
jgi:hypothetical protein